MGHCKVNAQRPTVDSRCRGTTIVQHQQPQHMLSKLTDLDTSECLRGQTGVANYVTKHCWWSELVNGMVW